jgi:hypothetical protein
MIYTITLIKMVNKPNVFPWDTRCVAFYYDLNKATWCVENKDDRYLDISDEGYYKYAVIEPRTEGPYSVGSGLKQYWYRWSEENNHYIKCKTPKRFRRVCGFGIG